MNKILHIGSRLMIICAVAALILGLVNAFTAPVIENRKLADLEESLQVLIDEGQIMTPVDIEHEDPADPYLNVNRYYPVVLSDEVISYTLDLTGSGYGGDMTLLASYSLDGEVLDARLMENNETPGLGKKAEDPEYMNLFIGTGGSNPIPVRKNQLASQEQVDSISGASITFMGLSKALSEGSQFVKTLGDLND